MRSGLSDQSHPPVVGRSLGVVSPLIPRGRTWGLAPKISAQEQDRTGVRTNGRRDRVKEMSKKIALDQENRERRQTDGKGERGLGEAGKFTYSGVEEVLKCEFWVDGKRGRGRSLGGLLPELWLKHRASGTTGLDPFSSCLLFRMESLFTDGS